MLPNYISQLFHTCENSDYDLRSNNLKLPQRKPKTNFLKNSFSYRGAAAWNNIPINSLNILKETTSLTGFHNIIDSCFNSLQYFTVPVHKICLFINLIVSLYIFVNTLIN
jgi:hypothetical protein